MSEWNRISAEVLQRGGNLKEASRLYHDARRDVESNPSRKQRERSGFKHSVAQSNKRAAWARGYHERDRANDDRELIKFATRDRHERRHYNRNPDHGKMLVAVAILAGAALLFKKTTTAPTVVFPPTPGSGGQLATLSPYAAATGSASVGM